MTVPLETLAVATMASTGVGVVFIVDPFLMYTWMAIVTITCIIVCVSITRKCNVRNKQIEMLSTRAKRRQLHYGTDPDQ